ncbi:hypothetical protein ILUMI_17042, partial [Ignelater luminosus]
METNTYQGFPTTCRACLKHISDESQVIRLNSMSWNHDFITIWQKLTSGVYGVDPGAAICSDCYIAVDSTHTNKEYTNTSMKSLFNDSIEEHRNELLPYKILSDILKDDHLPNNTQLENEYNCQTFSDKQIRTNQDQHLYLKNFSLFNPSFLSNCIVGRESYTDDLSVSIKSTHFSGFGDKSNYELPCCKLNGYVLDRPISIIAQDDIGFRHRKLSKPHKCNTCEFSATTRSRLTLHMATHTKQEPNINNMHPCINCEGGKPDSKCEQCIYQVFMMPKKSYSGSKPYKCTECEFRCSSRGYLNIHMRIHTGENPYKCEICGYGTPFKYTLSVHMRTHIGEKPYRCTECDFRCSTKNYLETHMRIHTGETPYRCNMCGYNTTFKYTLSVHMRSHLGNKPYQCHECNFKCSSESYYKKHMKSHSGEVYTCSICPYTAPCRSTVTLHMKTHTGEKPFKCTRCDYR